MRSYKNSEPLPKKIPSNTKASRKEITYALTQACMHYWVKKNRGVSLELGLNFWGKQRADVVALALNGHICICEVKSCSSDFQTDKKFELYLPYCNKLYIVVPPNAKWLKKHKPRLKELGIGIMTLSPATGYIKVVKNAKNRELDDEIKHNLMLRIAWRGSQYSKRNVKRRERIFI